MLPSSRTCSWERIVKLIYTNLPRMNRIFRCACALLSVLTRQHPCHSVILGSSLSFTVPFTQTDSLVSYQDVPILPPNLSLTSLATTSIWAIVILCSDIAAGLSSSSFAHLQSILHASARVILLKHESGHITTLLKHLMTFNSLKEPTRLFMNLSCLPLFPCLSQ